MFRIRNRMFLIFCAIFAPLGLVITLMASPAGAKPAPAPVNSPTIACQFEFPGNCITPVAAQALPASHNLVPGDDAAMTVVSPNDIASSLDNDQQDGTQDWVFGQDTVLTSGLYAGSPVDEIMLAPFGFDTGLCLQINVSPVTHTGRAVLRPCDGGADQQFIITKHVPIAGFAPTVYFWALSLLPAANAQHHLCLTMPHYLLGAQLTTTRCVHQTPGHGGPQFWTAI